MDAEQDIGLFIASNTGADDIMTIYMPLDQDANQADSTVRKAGLKDADAVCVGFRAEGACKCSHKLEPSAGRNSLLTAMLSLFAQSHAASASISQPIVQLTDVEEEEEEDAVDPDSIPPPLSE